MLQLLLLGSKKKKKKSLHWHIWQHSPHMITYNMD